MTFDVFGAGRFQSAKAQDFRSRLERRACSLPAVIATRHGEARVTIINLSSGGVGFTIDPLLTLKPGERITLRQPRLGEIACIVRWTLHPRCGAEFDAAGKPFAGVSAVYDSLAPG